MPCYDGVEPATFSSGVVQGEDPSPAASQIFIKKGELEDTPGVPGRKMVFEVNVVPQRFDVAVSVNYTTVNGTAIAGTHYTAKSGTLNIPTGESTGLIEVTVTGRHGDHKDRVFSVSLSSPVNATIGTGSANGRIDYEAAKKDPGGDDPKDGDKKPKLVNFVSWPQDKALYYNQFITCGTRAACTAYTVAATMSALSWYKNKKRLLFAASALYTASGGVLCSSCSGSCAGFYIGRVLARAKSVGATVISGGTGTRTLDSWHVIQVGSNFSAQKAKRKDELIRRIKKAIRNNGGVAVDSTWFSAWNTAGMSSANNYIMPSPGSSRSVGGHSYLLVGWRRINNRSCFVVHNSFGRNWANGGRAYLPFAYIDVDANAYGKGVPYFRFYNVQN